MCGVEQTPGRSRRKIDRSIETHCMIHRHGFAFYLDVFGGWRWEYYDPTGEAFDSRDSFDTRQECVENARACAPQESIRTQHDLCGAEDPALFSDVRRAA
jgi:hypothetical protein